MTFLDKEGSVIGYEYLLWGLNFLILTQPFFAKKKSPIKDIKKFKENERKTKKFLIIFTIAFIIIYILSTIIAVFLRIK